MRFTCEKSMLVQGLNIAGRTVAQKSSLSVIEGILPPNHHEIKRHLLLGRKVMTNLGSILKSRDRLLDRGNSDRKSVV